MMILMDEVQEVIGPPAVSVTTADVFSTIKAKVNLFILPVDSAGNDHQQRYLTSPRYSMITWNCQKVNASCTQTSQQKLIPTHVLTSIRNSCDVFREALDSARVADDGIRYTWEV